MNPAPLPVEFLRAREHALQQWFATSAPLLGDGAAQGTLQTVSGDASFRRYFRGRTGTRSWILVDAPPEFENSRTFVSVAQSLAAGRVCVPHVHASDLQQGFMCLDDFGSTLLWTPLEAARHAGDSDKATRLYESAFEQLLLIQQCDAVLPPLPLYDEALLDREMQLFSEWFCRGILGLSLDATETVMLETVFRFLVTAAGDQPRVFVHRDYHSRNLMYREGQPPGVLDFQDAVLGPITYDLVSLLRDCYIAWPREQVNCWALHFRELAGSAGLPVRPGAEDFLRDFDLMGIQRHLKAVGIFSRLWLRDGKPGYLGDIPRTLHYITTLAPGHQALQHFSDWLQARVMPVLEISIQNSLEAAVT